MSISKADILFLKRCAQIAQLGCAYVSPNPMVGCVIVKDNKIIAEGYHQKCGEAHAEVNAINKLPKGIDYSLLTIYVSLEPCSHFGKTPPCSMLIAKKIFNRLVISKLDDNELVNGRGLKVIEEAGIEFSIAKLSHSFNASFDYFHNYKRPFITLKWAETADGYMGRMDAERDLTKKISGKSTQIIVHKERAVHDAILIGMDTLIADRPKLNNREFYGKQPIPIIICTKKLEGDFSYLSNMYEKILIFSSVKQQKSLYKKFVIVDVEEDNLISKMLEYLFKNNITSVLVEGGRFTLQMFISSNIYNKVIRIVGHQNWGKGLKAPDFNKNPNQVVKSGEDIIYYYTKPI